MFEFMKRLPGENKKEYRRRLAERGTEIMKGIDCSDEERINVTALSRCKAEIVKFNGKFLPGVGITEEEYALIKGTAKDYEALIGIVYFKYLDHQKFENEKAKLWDELRASYYKNETNRNCPTCFDDYSEARLDQDEQYEEYGRKLMYSKRFKTSKNKI